MDLIIKPTQRCNFSCSYCSSTDIAKSNKSVDDLELSKVFQFLQRFPETNSIIVNGGDPLVMPPSYYEELLSYIESHNLDCKILFCTNLWDFYRSPQKWIHIFKHPNVSVGTSFNYGEEREIRNGQYLTQDLFLEILTNFKDSLGFYPSFVSVLTVENEYMAKKNVELAKELGVECKLNYQMMSGDAKTSYPIGKAYNIYLDIYESGLAESEFNTKQMLKKLAGRSDIICPQTRNCDEGIRNLQPQSDSGYEYGSCGAFGDDQEYGIDFQAEMDGDFIQPLSTSPELQYQKEECLSCPNFNICNGCYKTVRDHKKAGIVEASCIEMKKFRQRAVELNLV
jgi:sulfatase maturation enzyme AslB (radical SAM superfamily)